MVFSIPFWEKHPLHLIISDLSDDFTNDDDMSMVNALSVIRTILDNNSLIDTTKGLFTMLNSGNWRVHVLVVVILIMDIKFRTEEVFSLIRARIRVGTWASPQLLVVLNAYDNQFPQNMMDVLDDSFEIRGYVNLDNTSKLGSNAFIKEQSQKVKSAMKWLINNEFEADNEGMKMAKSWSIRLLQIQEYLDKKN
ncbi:hypothetical protein [Flammeovirga agarivorans]|uniref:Uncharacterized protein n=1 Tax=Flammeovirga agarivorans TaxID=2726742 RepID=A0A7X8SQZ8_9BACT|nr:hypothetical protein [Flammeovirga agarivorans]NLR94642.1 hypothetical protein [Flammeovirga agarivorans]